MTMEKHLALLREGFLFAGLVLDHPRNEDQIVKDWKVENIFWLDYKWRMPPKPMGKHLRRRRRANRP